ncbi:MAG: hypothetical protein [Circular genetic element sp.]|nr:MAG: hypothetical protein [Circular genetic element sp.]
MSGYLSNNQIVSRVCACYHQGQLHLPGPDRHRGHQMFIDYTSCIRIGSSLLLPYEILVWGQMSIFHPVLSSCTYSPCINVDTYGT